MPYRKYFFFILILIAGITPACRAQIADTAVARKLFLAKDSISAPKEKLEIFKETDSTKLKNPHARTPAKAALRSAVLPGWGQVYNKKIWKVPIVYAMLGGLGYYFVFNHKQYKNYQLGAQIAYAFAQGSKDSTDYNKIKDNYIRTLINKKDQNTLQEDRDWYHQKRDYSAIYFIAGWLLNVIDATVDAHLSTFDINPNLVFKIEPGHSELAKTNGISLIVRFK